LHHQIAKLASQEKIDSLKDYAHPEALLTGARLLLQAANILPYELFMNNARQLATIEANQPSWQQEIRRAIQQKSNERNWKRYRVAAIVVITLLLCLLIAS
jgi:succinate dehydrogenase hydrophobic anchor subunit